MVDPKFMMKRKGETKGKKNTLGRLIPRTHLQSSSVGVESITSRDVVAHFPSETRQLSILQENLRVAYRKLE